MQCLTLQKIWFFEKKDGNSDDSTNNAAEPVDESVVSETLDTSKDYIVFCRIRFNRKLYN